MTWREVEGKSGASRRTLLAVLNSKPLQQSDIVLKHIVDHGSEIDTLGACAILKETLHIAIEIDRQLDAGAGPIEFPAHTVIKVVPFFH
jgi:hypothetical protein